MPAGPTVLQVLQPPDGGVAEHVARLTEGLSERMLDELAALYRELLS